MSPIRKPTLEERANSQLPLTSTVMQILLSLSTEDRHGLGIADSPAGDSDDPRRRYYRITPLGRRVLELETERLATLVGTAHRRRAFKRP